MTVTVPYSWVKKVSPSLLQDDEIPLFGHPPVFPWEQFSQLLSKRFELKEFKVVLQGIQWRTSEELLADVGEGFTPLHFSLSPVTGSICWIFPESEINFLMSLCLTKQLTPLDGIDQDFRKGLYLGVLVEAMHAFTQLPFDKALSPQLLEKDDLPAHDSLCLDIALVFPERTFMGRLLITPEFLSSWKERFASKTLGLTLEAAVAKKIEVIVQIEAGRTSIKLSEWKKIRLGDFLSLDACSLKGEIEGGRVMLTIKGEPIFRARIKNGNVKILEQPLYHEVDTVMSKNVPNHESDNSVDGEDDSLFEGVDDVGFEDEDLITEESESQEALEGHEEEEHEGEESEANAHPPAKKMIAAEDIDLTVVVEVGRLQINVQKLMEIQPGNILDLDLHPENGVDLVVNGQRIAKGELLLIGDVLGVRILDIN